ncbi:MAG: pantoate--beta-alanine ligase [Proteobacteria bacterium SG_bin7]|nr:MAG: pantoate--beta-alanine ligase [Proteobacteria bacterium SG_bin7]
MTVVFKNLKKWTEFTKGSKYFGKQVGFVPTMGALHEGHASLFKRSKAENEITVVSIFVNPTQFNNQNDFKNYPVTMESDLHILETCGVDYLLLPNYDEMYRDKYRYRVEENEVSSILCGAHRPGHFAGVLTVVMKLLNLARANKAYFGEKDYQQYILIKGMAESFFLPTEIIPCATIRAKDGLALSSRNLRLSASERELANSFASELKKKDNIEKVKENLINKGFQVDYIEDHFGRRFGAVHLGDVRLIDNVSLS